MKRLIPIICVILLTTACGTTPESGFTTRGSDSSPVTTRPTVVEPATTEPGQQQGPGTGSGHWQLPDDDMSGTTLVAATRHATDIYAEPSAPTPELNIPWTTILGTVTVLTAVGTPVVGWLEVMVPGRPNGRTGWVRTADVDLYAVSGIILIDLSERRLTYYTGDETVLTTAVAVGNESNPTPTGTFFVTDAVAVGDASGPWGPHALGLSARSETITEFNGGDGIIGIHGTNRPDSIGTAASLGCVRIPNEAITRLYEMVPIGTPVEIRA